MHGRITRIASQGMQLAFCLLLAAPAAAARASDCALAPGRIEIKGELRPAGPRPVLVITVPELEDPPARP
ncbi:MAG: hypothetical protein IT556_04510 [Acetobacteraceae bacterium]|nr:hypothetical protein [Acetobacteraceae bacterium]